MTSENKIDTLINLAQLTSTSPYSQILDWQKKQNIFIGDSITFTYKGKKRNGYLTGFDFETFPIKLIVRYISRMGYLQIVTIDKEDILNQSSFKNTIKNRLKLK